MNEQKIKDAKDGEVIDYMIYRDCLVYVFKTKGFLRAGVLQSFDSCIRNDDVLYINLRDFEGMRKATINDFNYFRVSSKGHIG